MKLVFGKHAEKDENILHLENLAYICSLKIIISFVSSFVQQFHIIDSSIASMAVYALSLLVIVYRVRMHIFPSDFVFLLLMYVPFVANYLLFPATRSYLLDQSTLIVLGFFFPICIFSVRKISRWEAFFPVMRKFAFFAILLAISTLLFLNYQEYVIYMGFSYALLPFICASYHTFRTQKDTASLLLFLVGLVAIVSFGARAVILFSLMYVMLFEITRKDKSNFYKIPVGITFVVGIVLIGTYMVDFANYLLSFSLFEDSYFLKNIVRNTLLESEGRETIYEMCQNRISSMGTDIAGLFGDRRYLGAHGAYPHNIAYEVLMTYGWMFGIVALILLSVLLIKTLFSKQGEKRSVALVIVLSVMARYIISGSYLIEGMFWIGLFALIALCQNKKKERIA